jgi:hypothetical protein
MAKRASTLLGAMLRNESGGRNIPNVHQGTTSGQAQGYFQITTGTWRDFAPRAGIDLNQYPNALKAPYEVQAKVAHGIPLKRWDPSTVALMRATGRPVDPNRTFGENLAMNGESFADFSPKDGAATATNQYKLPKAQAVGGAGVYQPPAPEPSNTPANATTSPSSVTPPYGQDQPPAIHELQPAPYFLGGSKTATAEPENWLELFGTKLGEAAKAPLPQPMKSGATYPKAAITSEAPIAPVAAADPNKRMALAQIMAQLNAGKLF